MGREKKREWKESKRIEKVRGFWDESIRASGSQSKQQLWTQVGGKTSDQDERRFLSLDHFKT